MAPLKPRQERFCRRFAEFGCAAVAARAAGYAPGSANRAGYRLLRHPRIAARIAAIEAETGRLIGGDDAVLIGRLETIFRRANADHQFHAAVRAVDLQARLWRESARRPAAAVAAAVTGPAAARGVDVYPGQNPF